MPDGAHFLSIVSILTKFQVNLKVKCALFPIELCNIDAFKTRHRQSKTGVLI